MSDFSEFLHEAFQLFGPVTIRRMFGGHGVYRDGLMFALVHEDTLYLKTDAQSVAYFEARSLPAFSFRKNDRLIATSYYQAPAEILEDRTEAAVWARRAFEVALRKQASKTGTVGRQGASVAKNKRAKKAAKKRR
jgi:DNA transformation protein and related proteins